MSVNGVSLENVDYGTAVSVLRDSGAAVNLVVKRRIVLGAYPEPTTYKVTLTKSKKKDGMYGTIFVFQSSKNDDSIYSSKLSFNVRMISRLRSSSESIFFWFFYVPWLLLMFSSFSITS
jgi:hypothetical protein